MYNDFGIEPAGAKNTGAINLVKTIQSYGAQIDAVGFESHFSTSFAPSTSDLTAGMSSNPYEASSGGVGVGGRGKLASSSSRAKALARMEEFEEENFTRLVQSKKDARKRRRDEADVALGGAGEDRVDDREQDQGGDEQQRRADEHRREAPVAPEQPLRRRERRRSPARRRANRCRARAQGGHCL